MCTPADPRHILIAHAAVDPRPYTTQLKHLGFRFTLIKKRPTDEDRACFDRVFDWDYQDDVDATLGLVERLHAEDPLHGVTSFSESGVIIASLIARYLHLPGNPPAAALRARNKLLMRRALKAAGLPSPAFVPVRTPEQVLACLREAGEPMVLKPISGSSSYGVIKVTPSDRLADIGSHLSAVKRYINNYRDENPQYPFEFWLPDARPGIPAADVFDPSEVFLLEGFLEGRQVSVDGIVYDGEVSCLGAIEIERIRDPHYFLEYEEWMPTRLGDEMERKVHETVERAVHAVGLRRCCFHCELKVGPQGIFVLEVAARRGADNISDFLRRIMGVDIYEEGVRLAAGDRRIYRDLRPSCCMKMRYFLPERSGVLQAIEGLDAVRRDPRVSEVDLEFGPGDDILAPPEGYEFLGYISVVGGTPEEADAALEELYPRVTFHIEPHAQAGARVAEAELTAR